MIRGFRAKRKKATPAGPPFAKRAYIAPRPFSSTIRADGAHDAAFQAMLFHASAISEISAWPRRMGAGSPFSLDSTIKRRVSR